MGTLFCLQLVLGAMQAGRKVGPEQFSLNLHNTFGTSRDKIKIVLINSHNSALKVSLIKRTFHPLIQLLALADIIAMQQIPETECDKSCSMPVHTNILQTLYFFLTSAVHYLFKFINISINLLLWAIARGSRKICLIRRWIPLPHSVHWCLMLMDAMFQRSCYKKIWSIFTPTMYAVYSTWAQWKW